MNDVLLAIPCPLRYLSRSPSHSLSLLTIVLPGPVIFTINNAVEKSARLVLEGRTVMLDRKCGEKALSGIDLIPGELIYARCKSCD